MEKLDSFKVVRVVTKSAVVTAVEPVIVYVWGKRDGVVSHIVIGGRVILVKGNDKYFVDVEGFIDVYVDWGGEE